jgi:hypothetical protein
MKRTILTAILGATVVAVLALPGIASAAKPPRSSTAASITINQAAPHLGDWVTFTYSVPGTVSSPRIQIMCYQSGALVYGEAGPATQSFLLGGGGSIWRTNGGAADCVATLYEWDFHPVQTFVPYSQTSFHAATWR